MNDTGAVILTVAIGAVAVHLFALAIKKGNELDLDTMIKQGLSDIAFRRVTANIHYPIYEDCRYTSTNAVGLQHRTVSGKRLKAEISQSIDTSIQELGNKFYPTKDQFIEYLSKNGWMRGNKVYIPSEPAKRLFFTELEKYIDTLA